MVFVHELANFFEVVEFQGSSTLVSQFFGSFEDRVVFLGVFEFTFRYPFDHGFGVSDFACTSNYYFHRLLDA